MADVTQLHLGWAFLAGAESLEAVDETIFGDSEELYSLGAAIAVLGDHLREEREEGVLRIVAEVQAALAENQALAVRSAALRLARLVHGRSRRRIHVQSALERAKIFFADSSRSGINPLMAEIRSAPRNKGLRGPSHFNPLEIFVRDKLMDQLRRYGSKAISEEWRWIVAQKFAKKMTGAISPDRIDDVAITGIAARLDSELRQLRPTYSGDGVPPVLEMLDVISAGQILEICELIGNSLAGRIANNADPMGDARKIKKNQSTAIEGLKAKGFGSRAKTFAHRYRVSTADNPEAAAALALRMAQGEAPPPPRSSHHRQRPPQVRPPQFQMDIAPMGVVKKWLVSSPPIEVPISTPVRIERKYPLAEFLALPAEEQSSTIPGRPELWDDFKKSAPPGIFDGSGEVLPEIDGTAALLLVAEASNFSHPRREVLQYGILRLLCFHRANISLMDYRLIVHAAESTRLLSASLPPPPVLPNPSHSERGKAAELLFRIRRQPGRRGFGFLKRSVASRIQTVFQQFYRSVPSQEVPKRHWDLITRLLSRKMAAHLPPETLGRDVVLAIAEMIYRDCAAVQVYIYRANQKSLLVIRALDHLSAAEIARLFGEYKPSIVWIALKRADPIKSAEIFEANWQAVVTDLTEKGFGKVAQWIASHVRIFAAKTKEEAIRRANLLAQVYRKE